MKIKNWHQFQHFKDRKPPWIKLYRDILDDVDWHELDAEASKVLVMLWLIASEFDGSLPDTRTLAFRLRLPEKQVKTIVSKLGKWLDQDDIKPISERHHDDAPETETEREEERETEREAQLPRSNRGTRLPNDWSPTGEQLAFARGLGVDGLEQGDRFRDYWIAQPGQKGVKLDWNGTWRNWVRRAAERSPAQTKRETPSEIGRRILREIEHEQASSSTSRHSDLLRLWSGED